MKTALLAVHVLMNVQLEQSLRVIVILSTLMLVQSAEHVQVFVLLRQFLFLSN